MTTGGELTIKALEGWPAQRCLASTSHQPAILPLAPRFMGFQKRDSRSRYAFCGFPTSYAAMVTSTSTPASMFTMICFTISVGAFKLYGSMLASVHVLAQSPRSEGGSLDKTLVDAHFVCVPSLGALTAGRLASGDFEDLGRHSNRTFDAQVLGLRARQELSAWLLWKKDKQSGVLASQVDIYNPSLIQAPRTLKKEGRT